MVKNENYKIQIKKEEFFNIIKLFGMDKLDLSVEKKIGYVPSNNNFLDKEFPYEWLTLITTKTNEKEKTIFQYKHYYPENGMCFTDSKEYQTEIFDPKQFKNILENLNFKIISNEIIKSLNVDIDKKYNMKLENINKTIYFLEIRTIDYHYITKKDFDEINKYLTGVGVKSIDNSSSFK